MNSIIKINYVATVGAQIKINFIITVRTTLIDKLNEKLHKLQEG